MPTRVSMTLLLLLCAFPIGAADQLPQVFSCGRQGVAGGLGAGTDLTRYTLDTAQFPDAVCNDGTPAVFYYGASTQAGDRDKWIIFLQGGGNCVDGTSCAERWCSIDTNYGMDKMSSSLTRPSIRGNGFLDPGSQNQFGSWNRVLVFYCSSDAWSGDSTRTLQAVASNGETREYEIRFKGARIIDAVLDTLRNVPPGGRRRVARHDAGGEEKAGPWPDLDDADAVLFAGSSAGGAGARANLDRVGAKLRAANPGVDFRGLIDAAYGSLAETMDFSRSTYCANDPARGCRYDTFIQSTQQAIHTGLYGSRTEESCLQWHAANAPGTEWRCADGEHVTLHHLSTPFFLHQDLQDPQVGGGFVDAGFGSASDYARKVEAELRNLPAPEEARGGEVGMFIPQCTDHESFTGDSPVFRVRLAGVSYHDTVWNWWRGVEPRQVIRPFSGTVGPAPECP